MENVITTKETPVTVSAKSNMVLIGLGQMGATALSRTAREYDPDENPFMSLMAVESNRRVLEVCFERTEGPDAGHLSKWLDHQGKDQNRFCTFQLGEYGFGAGGDLMEGERMAKEKKKELEDYFARFNSAALAVGGGGGTCGAAPVIAGILQELQIPTYAILTMPFQWEGPKRAGKAATVRDLMYQLCPTTLIENERVPEEEQSLPIDQVWHRINERSLFWILRQLKAFLQDTGELRDQDFSDWKRGTKIGNYTVPGFFDASKGFDKLEEELLGNPYLNYRILENALEIDCLSEGPWSVSDVKIVSACIRRRMHIKEPYEFKWGFRRKGIPENVKTVSFFAFAKEPPKEADAVNEEQEGSRRIFGSAAVPDGATMMDTQEEIPASQDNSNPAKNGSDKIDFYGTLNHEKIIEPVRVSTRLAQRYEKLWGRQFSIELDADSKEVQELIYQETGIRFDVPLRPVPIMRSAGRIGEEGRIGQK